MPTFNGMIENSKCFPYLYLVTLFKMIPSILPSQKRFTMQECGGQKITNY